MKKVLIFGGEGYIGQVVKKYLIRKKYKLTTYDNLIYQKKIKKNKKNFIYGDICNTKKIQNIIEDYNYIVILSGLVGDPISKKYPIISRKINLIGTKNLIKICVKKKLEKVIFVSTCSNYGISDNKKRINENSELKPLSLYAKDKVKIEKFILSLKNKTKTCFTILRFATAFGLSPRMRFDLTVNEFVLTLFKKIKLKLYDVDTFRPYCHVLDFARLINIVFKQKEKKVRFQVFNVGSTKNNFSKLSLALLIKSKIKNSEFKIIKKSKDRRDYNVSFSKVEKVLNFKAKYSLNYGIREIIKFLKKNKNKRFNNFGNHRIYYK